MAELHGPIEDGQWASVLESRVVDAGPPPRIHGYDVWHDLARHYRHGELVLTTLVGAPPDAAHGRAFELALMLAAPTTLAAAPTHATAIARMIGAPAASALTMAALVLSEQVQAMLDEHAEWIAWLDMREGDPPARFIARDEADRWALAVVRELIGEAVCPALAHVDATLPATIVALLHACGLRTPQGMLVALVTARLPAAMAEAESWHGRSLRSYPMQLPPYDYREDEP